MTDRYYPKKQSATVGVGGRDKPAFGLAPLVLLDQRFVAACRLFESAAELNGRLFVISGHALGEQGFGFGQLFS